MMILWKRKYYQNNTIKWNHSRLTHTLLFTWRFTIWTTNMLSVEVVNHVARIPVGNLRERRRHNFILPTICLWGKYRTVAAMLMAYLPRAGNALILVQLKHAESQDGMLSQDAWTDRHHLVVLHTCGQASWWGSHKNCLWWSYRLGMHACTFLSALFDVHTQISWWQHPSHANQLTSLQLNVGDDRQVHTSCCENVWVVCAISNSKCRNQ